MVFTEQARSLAICLLVAPRISRASTACSLGVSCSLAPAPIWWSIIQPSTRYVRRPRGRQVARLDRVRGPHGNSSITQVERCWVPGAVGKKSSGARVFFEGQWGLPTGVHLPASYRIRRDLGISRGDERRLD